ncbi:unnamed protein product [Moneuplotes crassus]|uniref:Amino acid transporter transmembrane domain-containing protein n=1 Tax=Euplotes crassus TaxID=5936 RepID=A0AAD1UCV2_EUPCR|nr:unnamed protein product [Moneuplotes crassus]
MSSPKYPLLFRTQPGYILRTSRANCPATKSRKHEDKMFMIELESLVSEPEYEKDFNSSNCLNDSSGYPVASSNVGKPAHLGSGTFRAVKDYFKKGEVRGSTFTLITAVLGSGTITFPYLAMNNGILGAALLIIFGAVLCHFTGMLLISCANKIGSDKYEDFAAYCFGRKMVLLTGWSNVLTLLGFVISYIVFLKNLIPHILDILFGLETLPEFIGNGEYKGQIFWATMYTFFVLLPLSIPRKIGTLQFTSVFGVFCSLYLIICITLMFFDKTIVPDMSKSIAQADYLILSWDRVANALPFVVFSFMYQPNMPIIYTELNQKSYSKMNKVVTYGTTIGVVLYITVSTFGYLGLVGDEEKLSILREKSNILEVPYPNTSFKIAIIGLVFAIFSAAPVCSIPAKDACEKILYPTSTMTPTQNFFMTIAICIGCYCAAVGIPGIGDAITIFGCTLNPLIGFILPVVFYLKVEDQVPMWKRAGCYFVLVFITCVSVSSFIFFLKQKLA